MKIATLLSLAATTVTAAVLPRQNSTDSGKPKTFRLFASTDAPQSLLSQGAVDWDGDVGGNIGWFKGEKDFTSFIQYNAKEGIDFYAKDTALELYLRPSGAPSGFPEYVATLGNPDITESPDSLKFSNWTVSDGTPSYLGYLGNYDGVWSACGGNNSWTLYYGSVVTPAGNCTDNFNIQVEYLD